MSPIRASEQAKYPKNWPTIRARILRRANDRCEFERADGTRCNAPNGVIVFRNVVNLEDWCGDWSDDPEQLERNAERANVGCWNPVKIVLTIAHLNHDPADCRDENLKAGCQLHHLRYDVDHHKQTAAATRRAQKRNRELFI